MKYIRSFDLLKAFGYFERVVKSDLFSGKDLFCFAKCSKLPFYISTMVKRMFFFHIVKIRDTIMLLIFADISEWVGRVSLKKNSNLILLSM